ncbi:hypothetical protein K504DRAFT_453108 [Pleomassaria siparia CBS 279.74]|uniref:Uncharacterized protein n=1 Tax=Pleomassaria siparia CBS 279.74 TaxID=1314801 RepID=A0A6G1JPW8_9PLEO|nr:hypothetical protein K504DRAFT_453108 [Pleomassaria siparia CBS 279.74]
MHDTTDGLRLKRQYTAAVGKEALIMSHAGAVNIKANPNFADLKNKEFLKRYFFIRNKYISGTTAKGGYQRNAKYNLIVLVRNKVAARQLKAKKQKLIKEVIAAAAAPAPNALGDVEEDKPLITPTNHRDAASGDAGLKHLEINKEPEETNINNLPKLSEDVKRDNKEIDVNKGPAEALLEDTCDTLDEDATRYLPT